MGRTPGGANRYVAKKVSKRRPLKPRDATTNLGSARSSKSAHKSSGARPRSSTSLTDPVDFASRSYKRPRSPSGTSSSSLSSPPSEPEFKASATKRPRSSIARLKPASTGKNANAWNPLLPSPSQDPLNQPSSSRSMKRTDSTHSVATTSTEISPSLPSSQVPISFFESFGTRPMEDVWRLEDVVKPHNLVFVKLSAPPGDDGFIDEHGTMWWPATVSLFGLLFYTQF